MPDTDIKEILEKLEKLALQMQEERTSALSGKMEALANEHSNLLLENQKIDQAISSVRESVSSVELQLKDLTNAVSQLHTQLITGPNNREGIVEKTGSSQRRDIMLFQRRIQEGLPKPFQLQTRHSVAYESADHINPRGTLHDNSRGWQFVAACERLKADSNQTIKFMDLGCSGGGLVLDFILRGHRAIGLEGSDLSKRLLRAEWLVLGEYLTTCDITKPFGVMDEDTRAEFDFITAWEVLEHIHEGDLPKMLGNVREHLTHDGLFIGSVATFEDKHPVTGADLHVTIKEKPWWEEVFRREGFEVIESPFEVSDYVRGAGNVDIGDWDVRTNPELGFHVVARRKE